MVCVMENRHEIRITVRDRLFWGWQMSMELVRDYETFSKQIENDDEAVKLFESFAEDEGHHAAAFIELLKRYEDND